jgi:3-methyladenine DNA glycosylase/8-oxoguanine DNA glycosylase
MQILIPTPVDFSFKRTAISHGWSELPPFEIDLDNWAITRVIDLGRDRAATVRVTEAEGALKVETRRKPGRRDAEKITRDVRHIFRLDDDMADFYELVASDADFSWIARAGAGRLLRSPTVFEDLVKTICTTNCTWGLTKKMVDGLVSSLGVESDAGRRAFPTPEAMAAAPADFYRDAMRAGYRAPYFKELADQVAAGVHDVEGWLTSELPEAELKREMKRVKGVGDYAAENLLKLIGRYDGLALDSWVRAKFARTKNRGRATPDKKIERYYSRFGRWRGLALWCDMTRDWIGEDGKLGF